MKQKKGKYLVTVSSPSKERGRHTFGVDLDDKYPVILDSINAVPIYFDKQNFLYSVWERPELINLIYELKKL